MSSQPPQDPASQGPEPEDFNATRRLPPEDAAGDMPPTQQLPPDAPTQQVPRDVPPQYQAYPSEAAQREGAQPAFAAPPTGPVGKIRGTGMCILLEIVTLGIYGLYWWYSVHKEMKEHSNQGIGGGIALILAIFIGIVMPYLTSNEIGDLYQREGKERRVSAVTGLWYFPGILIIVGPIIWFVKTNGALNDYWQEHGAVAGAGPGASPREVPQYPYRRA
jgi:hypothetical protein